MKNIAVMCNVCNESHIVRVKSKDYDRFSIGELIQNASPYLTPNERELLISGTCGKCFDEMFSK